MQIDQAKAEAFAGKMLAVLNDSCIALLMSIGHQTGLFDKLAALPPSTSGEIASSTGLQERYVREWLGGMVTGGIIEYDPAGKTYRLPPEHAAFTTREAGPDNFAFFFQYIPLMGNIEPQIVDVFRKGGGLPYSAYPAFQELQREESARIYDAALVDAILPFTGLVERLTAGGTEVLDIGCGGGHAINVMARAFPNSRFAGYDISEEGVGLGRAEAQAWGLTNARFEAKDVSQLDESGKYDLITAFDTVHDQAWPRKVLAGAARALKPGGTFLMADINTSSKLEENVEHPMGPALYTFSTLHCMTVSLAQGGEGLGTCWGEQLARELLKEAGFNQVATKSVEGDFFNLYYLCKK
jgi:SAM-dependent methyltransferase